MSSRAQISGQVGRVTPCAPGLKLAGGGAHGVTRPTISPRPLNAPPVPEELNPATGSR